VWHSLSFWEHVGSNFFAGGGFIFPSKEAIWHNFKDVHVNKSINQCLSLVVVCRCVGHQAGGNGWSQGSSYCHASCLRRDWENWGHTGRTVICWVTAFWLVRRGSYNVWSMQHLLLTSLNSDEKNILPWYLTTVHVCSFNPQFSGCVFCNLSIAHVIFYIFSSQKSLQSCVKFIQPTGGTVTKQISACYVQDCC